MPALLSRSNPAEFKADQTFDVIFALSFFSHMPDATWGAWFRALFANLAEHGLLIFTTHGRAGYEDLGRPQLAPSGFWFAPMSEQKDLPTEEYGCTVVTPSYVLEKAESCAGAALVFFREGFWWGKQDVYVVQRTSSDDFRRRPASVKG